MILIGVGARAESADATAERRQFARSVGARAIVMLKNEAGALPLPSRCARGGRSGRWRMQPAKWAALVGAPGNEAHVSVLRACARRAASARCGMRAGVAIAGEDHDGIAAGTRALRARRHRHPVPRRGRHHERRGGEPGGSGPAGTAAAVCRSAFRARARRCGKPVIAVLFSGRPLIVPWLVEQADAVLAGWFLGSEAGHAIADVVSGRVSPERAHAVTWPRASDRFRSSSRKGRAGGPPTRRILYQ